MFGAHRPSNLRVALSHSCECHKETKISVVSAGVLSDLLETISLY
jgi:hypothetical protein